MSVGEIFSISQRVLINTGYNILVAFDGESALGLIWKLKPVLIFLDVMMPGLDGFEVRKTPERKP